MDSLLFWLWHLAQQGCSRKDSMSSTLIKQGGKGKITKMEWLLSVHFFV